LHIRFWSLDFGSWTFDLPTWTRKQAGCPE
jgi:hypothetical protein